MALPEKMASMDHLEVQGRLVPLVLWEALGHLVKMVGLEHQDSLAHQVKMV